MTLASRSNGNGGRRPCRWSRAGQGNGRNPRRVGRNSGWSPRCHLPMAHRGIALLLEQLGDRMFFGAEPDRANRTDDVGHRNPLGIAAGHHLRPRRRADRRGVETGEFHPLRRHAVEVRRAVQFRAERSDVAVAHVINEDDDEVRFRRIGRAAGIGCQTAQSPPRRRQASGRVSLARSAKVFKLFLIAPLVSRRFPALSIAPQEFSARAVSFCQAFHATASVCRISRIENLAPQITLSEAP